MAFVDFTLWSPDRRPRLPRRGPRPGGWTARRPLQGGPEVGRPALGGGALCLASIGADWGHGLTHGAPTEGAPPVCPCVRERPGLCVQASNRPVGASDSQSTDYAAGMSRHQGGRYRLGLGCCRVIVRPARQGRLSTSPDLSTWCQLAAKFVASRCQLLPVLSPFVCYSLLWNTAELE